MKKWECKFEIHKYVIKLCKETCLVCYFRDSYDELESPYFELFYVLMYRYFLTSILAVFTNDFLFFGAGMNIAYHFKNLRNCIKEDHFNLNLFVDRHVQLMDLAKQFNRLYEHTLLVQFFVMVSSIAFLGLRINFVGYSIMRLVRLLSYRSVLISE